VIVADLVVLAVLVVVGALYVTKWRTDSQSSSSSDPASSSATTSIAPFRTTYGLAWTVAACGGPMILQDMGQSTLPRANETAVCLAPVGGAAIAIGVYDDRAALDEDVAEVGREHRQATRTDDGGKVWLFLVEGQDSAPLQPLQRYGFQSE
jgi:hypothetical protein